MTTALVEEDRAPGEGLPEDLEPLTAAASGGAQAGVYGQELFAPGDAELTIDGLDQDTSSLDPEAVDEAIANSRAMRLILDGGVLNGDFRTGPPNPNEPIGPGNPLPGWRYGGGTGAPGDIDSPDGLTLYWREDDDGTGYGPHVECIADEALSGEVYAERYVYIEQLVPIASRERVLAPRALCSYDGGSALLAYVEATPYHLDGGTAGPTTIAEQGFGQEAYYASGGVQFHQQPVEAALNICPNPSGGAFLLIRLMFFTNNDVWSPPETSKVYEVTNARPHLVQAGMAVGQTNLSQAPGATDFLWVDRSDSAIAVAAQAAISISTGWCSGIGLRTTANRTGGQYAIAAYSSSQSACLGGPLEIDGTHAGFTDSRGYLHRRDWPYYADTLARNATPSNLEGVAQPWNIFSGGERLHAKGDSHGAGNFNPSGVDVMAYPVFTYVMEDGAALDNNA